MYDLTITLISLALIGDVGRDGRFTVPWFGTVGFLFCGGEIFSFHSRLRFDGATEAWSWYTT